MGKFLSILIGLILLALGIWGVLAWRADVLIFLKAAVALMAIAVGLGIFVFGWCCACCIGRCTLRLDQHRRGDVRASSQGGRVLL